jgi:hypothetical protein
MKRGLYLNLSIYMKDSPSLLRAGCACDLELGLRRDVTWRGRSGCKEELIAIGTRRGPLERAGDGGALADVKRRRGIGRGSVGCEMRSGRLEGARGRRHPRRRPVDRWKAMRPAWMVHALRYKVRLVYS